MNISQIKGFLNKHQKLRILCVKVYDIHRKSKIRVGGGIAPSVQLIKAVRYDSGKNNRIDIEDDCVLKDCVFRFIGSNNHVIIKKGCSLNFTTVWIEDNNNTVIIGTKTTIQGKTDIACIEGTTVSIGDDCMFSSNIRLRSGDSHSVINSAGDRINASRDIHLGNHVWVGQDVFIGKGANVPDNSILGACSVVTRQFDEPNVAIAGNPAKVIKNNVNWKRERL